MTQRRSREFWQGHLESWRQSGLTQVAYCAAQGLSITTFTRWRTRERNGAVDAAPTLTLIPLQVSAPGSGSVLQMHSPGGWRIELSGTPLAELAAVLRQLP